LGALGPAAYPQSEAPRLEKDRLDWNWFQISLKSRC
jgi:hypothetical protein